MVTNDQMNMPAFQRYCPLFTYSSARSKCGFSTNRSALKKAVLDFEADDVWVLVSTLDVIDGHSKTLAVGAFGGDGAEQVGCEGGDAAFAREVIAEEGDLADTVRLNLAHAFCNAAPRAALPGRGRQSRQFGKLLSDNKAVKLQPGKVDNFCKGFHPN